MVAINENLEQNAHFHNGDPVKGINLLDNTLMSIL